MPIIIADQHLATLFMGQFFYEDDDLDKTYFLKQAEKYGFDVQEYMRALSRVPVYTREQIQHIMDYYTDFVDFVSSMGTNNLALKKNMYDLEERVKEQKCLYGISSLAQRRGLALEEILQGIVDIIPPAWQYPENTCARIILEGKEIRTGNFEKSVWKQASDITVNEKQSGTVEVCYLEEKPESEEGPFLKEERTLIDAIAGQAGRIIEHKRAEEALRESEKGFRDLVENSLTGFSIIQDNQIVFQNTEQQKLLGPLPRSPKFEDIKSIHPNDVEKVKEFYLNITSKEFRTLDMDFRFFAQREINSKTDMKWVNCRAVKIEYLGKGAVLINMTDITKTKEMEHLLRIQDKMTSLGRIAAGMAHEIRNPLSGINVYLNTLQNIYDKGESLEKVKRIIEQTQAASNKIKSVVKRVMDFSKPSAPKFVLIDINQPIEEAFNLSSVTLRKSGITVEKTLAEGLPLCRADPRLIEEVILNLITNAAEALRNVDKPKKIEISSYTKKNSVFVKVSDSGLGVPLNVRNQIFDPFYTTKDDGTGIGLSISHRIITDHGGFLSVSASNLGGAEFIVEIPKKKE